MSDLICYGIRYKNLFLLIILELFFWLFCRKVKNYVIFFVLCFDNRKKFISKSSATFSLTSQLESLKGQNWVKFSGLKILTLAAKHRLSWDGWETFLRNNFNLIESEIFENYHIFIGNDENRVIRITIWTSQQGFWPFSFINYFAVSLGSFQVHDSTMFLTGKKIMFPGLTNGLTGLYYLCW